MNIEILGCGVAGLCTATELAKNNVKIDLVDPNGGPTEKSCSWWAGGMLAPDCEGETAPDIVVSMGKKSSKWWKNNGCNVYENGSLVVAADRDVSKINQFKRKTRNYIEIDASNIEKLEPEISSNFNKGLFFEKECHITPRKALTSLMNAFDGSKISVRTKRLNKDYDFSIDCRGLVAKDTLKDLRGVKGEMLILKNDEIKIKRPIRLLHPRIPLYIVPRGKGFFMVGATMIENDERKRATVRSVFELLSAAYTINPAFGEAEVIEIGVDARPAFQDNIPKIRRRHKDIFINGLYRHGFLLAPSMAMMVSDFIFKGKIPEVMDENLY